MATATAFSPHHFRGMQLPFTLLLLWLILPSSVTEKSSGLFKKGAVYLKTETTDISSDAETSDELSTVFPEAQQSSDQIVGTEEKTVPVYVLINSHNLILNCLTEKLLMQRITDPKYLWTGPLGPITKESKKFVLSDDGSLEIYTIKGTDSGRYTCKVNYVYHTEHLTTEIHFMVYVYHMPDKSIHLLAEFTTGTCKTNTIASYEKYLFEKMESLISNLSCEIKQWRTQCHASTDTLEKITYKFTFQFVVFPFMLTTADFCRSSQCANSTSNIRKAYENIKEFFEVQKTDSSPIDQFSFVPGTFIGVKVDHCKPGFGKNIHAMNNNTMCPGCCVTCPPGRFSAKYDTVCILCPIGSYNEKYGQVECENCPEAESSDGKGAKTERECHRILPIWMAFLISSTATCIILVTTWAIIIKCCKKTIAAQYIREAESEVKKRLQEFASIASDAEIQEQRRKLSPIKLQRNKADFLEEESMALLSNDELTEPSTPAGASLSPNRTGPSELETSFEYCSSPTLENKRNLVPKDLPPNQQRLIDIMKAKLPGDLHH